MRNNRARHLLTSLVAFAIVLPTIASAAPSAKLWERWLANAPNSPATIDHGTWDGFLGAHVIAGPAGIHRMDYGAVSPQWRARLSIYVDELQNVAISSFDRAEQLAYWVNLYNALTLRVVLTQYPVESIRDIDLGGGFFADGPWQRKLVTVEGEAISLDDIEHRILRPIWKDPRIHYAVNCAAVGCPNLQSVAFDAENTEALLDSAARAYVNHPRGAEFVDGRLLVSSIYVWFRRDFGGNDAGVIAHLTRYADPPLVEELSRTRRIGGHRYDWSLNDSAAAR